MITVVRAIAVAFSMYSKIPMPHFKWREREIKYALCFFPWVGAVIGLLIFLWRRFCLRFCVGTEAYALILAAIPLAVTGGFHVDGFMDTMDAFRSYQPREKKLEILKDAHIGAFAVICLALYGLIYIAACSELRGESCAAIFAAGFFLSRALSGIAAVTFPCAKKEGTLYFFASRAQKTAVCTFLLLQAAAALLFMLYQSVWAGTAAGAGALLCFAYYRYRCDRELGGITGDTAGYFVTLCEGVIAVIAAVSDLVGLAG